MTMTTKVLTLLWGKCFFRLTSKRSAKSLTKTYLLNLLPLRLNFCRSYSSNSSIFDTVQMQKYLNFLSGGSSFLKNVDGVQSAVIRRVISLLEKKKNVEEELLNLNKMPSDGDKELEYLVEEERKTYLNVIAEIKSEILDDIDALNQEEDNRNVEIQIIPGVGGAEALLFGQELFSMYLKYINFKKWELKEADPKSGSILVSGDSVYNYFKHEAGVHRVQRVPETEKQGRTHTSTCSVAVLPQPKPHEVVIGPKDIIIDKMRSSGPGGQNVNKTESCVRVTHIPTGIVVESQTSRFQYENKSLALEKLKRILFNIENEKACSETQSLRKKQIGSNDYSDKIRTYHFTQNRVTDHRINYTTSNLKGFLSGTKELDEMIHKVWEFNKENEVLFFVEKILRSAEYKNFEKHAKKIQHSE